MLIADNLHIAPLEKYILKNHWTKIETSLVVLVFPSPRFFFNLMSSNTMYARVQQHSVLVLYGNLVLS